MKTFRVTVNGNVYDVSVEETNGISTSQTPTSLTVTPVAQIAQQPVLQKQPFAEAPISGDFAKVMAPMPGTILDIKVSKGDRVLKNQTLVVLEAIKMENEIVAPEDGTIVGVHVDKGASVNSGDILISLSK